MRAGGRGRRQPTHFTCISVHWHRQTRGPDFSTTTRPSTLPIIPQQLPVYVLLGSTVPMARALVAAGVVSLCAARLARPADIAVETDALQDDSGSVSSWAQYFAVQKAPAGVQGPGNYYAGIDVNANGAAFTAQLTALISQHKSLTYNDLWTAFKTTDIGTRDGGNCTTSDLGDLYSATCWQPGADQCGNYQKEGDCYNREHSWPKSWWGGAEIAAYTDLFHLYPADGYDNNRRANFPLGNVGTATYVTSNGSKLGSCVAAASAAPGSPAAVDLPATCWEPSGPVKGLLARAYFYVSVSYADTFTCCDTDGTNGAQIKEWLLATLLDWHNAYPVTAGEAERNDAVYALQGNRNPFVDYPEWVQKVFE